jgi:hypothetical protein
MTLAIDLGEARTRREAAVRAEPTPGTAAAPQEWAEPIDIIGDSGIVGWPELTAGSVPAPLLRYSIAEAERLNIDPAAHMAHVLAACASSITDAWRLKPKQHDHWTQQARIWSCVVKDVGERGTELIRSAFWPIHERDKNLRDQWSRDLAEWKAAKTAAKADKVAFNDPEPKCIRLVSTDATIEAAMPILADGDKHAKLTIVCDELVTFLGGFNRYTTAGGPGRALWLESYDGGAKHVDRVQRGHIFIPNWSAVVAGNVQPRRLAGMAKDLIADGLFQRFLTIHTRPAPPGLDDDQPLPVDVGREYRDLHGALVGLCPPTGADGELASVYCDEDARAERQRFMRLIERLKFDPTLPTVIREIAPKWSGLLARISLIFHLVQLAARVQIGETLTSRDLCQATGPTVAMAASFLRKIALPNLFKLGFETMPEEGAPAAHARWIAGHVLAHGHNEILARDIGRGYRPLRGRPAEIEQAMAVLCDAGWAARVESRVDSMRWRINPAVHSIFAEAAKREQERRERTQKVIRKRIAEL